MTPAMEHLRFPAYWTTGVRCDARDHHGHLCDRHEGHSGRHADHGAEYVIAVWGGDQ